MDNNLLSNTALQLRVTYLLHRNEEAIQINMENTASHETAYKLAHRADKANFTSDRAMGNETAFCDSLTPQHALGNAQEALTIPSIATYNIMRLILG
jgi:hypothetical protein